MHLVTLKLDFHVNLHSALHWRSRIARVGRSGASG